MKRVGTDQEVIDMMKREDYYLILKIKKNPREARGIKWNHDRL